MASISNKKKVALLEKYVLENDQTSLIELLEEFKEFEFTARALGFACRFCNLETVKILVENGATFEYESSAVFKAKYGIVIQRATGQDYAEYPLLMVIKDLNGSRRIGRITTGLDSKYTYSYLNQMFNKIN